MEKIEMANTLECSGNGRSLLARKASGNPWTIGGVGNAVRGGVVLENVLREAKVMPAARHVSFEGLDEPLGSAGIRFIRSIPLEKAASSTLLAYEAAANRQLEQAGLRQQWRPRTRHPCPGHRMNRRNALRIGLFGILYIDYSS
jgi:DMSO/TMAO reductase YedYZ molybdopterin-dependent catalytic subunit